MDTTQVKYHPKPTAINKLAANPVAKQNSDNIKQKNKLNSAKTTNSTNKTENENYKTILFDRYEK